MIMNKVSSIILFLAVAFTTISCGGCEEIQGENWGHTEYYKDHIFKEYVPVVMSRTLQIELNNDAARFFNDDDAYIEMGLSSDPDRFVEPENIKVYFDNEPCEDFTFRIHPKEQINKGDKELDKDAYFASGELGIEFLDDATEGEHKYYILYLDCAGKDILKLKGAEDSDWVNVSKKDLTHDYAGSIAKGVYATKEIVANPAAIAVRWTLIGIAAFVIFWLFLSRCVLWTSAFSKIELDYNDGYGATYARTAGCYEIVCTDDPKRKDSVFERIFKGKRAYIRNEFWIEPVTIKKGNKRRVIISGARNYDIEGELIRKEEIYITNSDSKKVTIRTT